MTKISISNNFFAFLIIMGTVCFVACNNQKSTDTSITDSTSSSQANNSNDVNGGATTDASSNNIGADANGNMAADAAATNFLQKAADGGLAEVSAGQMAEGKATNEGVKRFASMMVQDHTGANAKVKELAQQRNVTLPNEPSAEHKQKMDEVSKKNGKAFDKAYMDMMVDDHKKTISLFKESMSATSDNQVKDFINTTLPKLQMHLDSATAIRNKIQ